MSNTHPAPTAVENPMAAARTYFKRQIKRVVHKLVNSEMNLLRAELEQTRQQLDQAVEKLRADVPHMADYRTLVLMGKPVIYKALDGTLLECDDMQLYVEFVQTNQIFDDPALLTYFRNVTRAGYTVFDVGANIGVASILLGQLVGEAGKVFAFEADADTCRILDNNIKLNDLAARVTTINRAVYASVGTVELHVFSRRLSGWNTLGWYKLGKWEPQQARPVASVTLDAFCQEQQIEHIDLAKIDTEGAEPEVFAGAAGLLKRQAIDRLIFEVSQVPLAGMGHTVGDIVNPLVEAGYGLYQLTSEGQLEAADLEAMRTKLFGNYVALGSNCADRSWAR